MLGGPTSEDFITFCDREEVVFTVNFVVGMILLHLAECSTGLQGTWLCGHVGYIWHTKESQCWHCRVCKALDGDEV